MELRRIPFLWLKQKSILACAHQRVKEATQEVEARSEYLSRHWPTQTRGSSSEFFAKWIVGVLCMRFVIVLCVLLGLLMFGWLAWRKSSSHQQLGEASVPTINKQPVAFASRTFDPASPPANMPPLAHWETAECDSDFLSSASVRGEPRETDATHATVTITQIKMTLQLNINI
jgi:hypothetical protein